MFWRKILCGKNKLFSTQLLAQRIAPKDLYYRSYSVNFRRITLSEKRGFSARSSNESLFISIQRYCSSKGQYLFSGNTSQLREAQKEEDFQKIQDLFPQPRVTLNEFTSKTPDKVFEIHYKQNVTAPKGSRKKQKQQTNEWTCTYAFTWPEKIKFEGTALSKRLAAEKAAIQALHYLKENKRIDSKGNPLYESSKINELKTLIQEPIKISISENSVERMQRIWEDYQNGIKDIFDRTLEEAKHRVVTPQHLVNRDSSIDDEDGLSILETKTSDDLEDTLESTSPIHPVYCRHITPPSEETLQKRDRILKKKFERYDEELTPLPIDQYADQITSTLSAHRVSVLVGAAGCGKSTRAPALAVRGGRGDVVVCEPRRVAARGLAERVAQEMGEQVGETVGYQIRLESKPPRPPAGGILYCTTGVLLRRLQTNPGLLGCSHVFVDEAHERDVNTDLVLLLLKRALQLNPKLTVAVMSATLDIQVFTQYFDSCPVIEIPGRTHPVQVSYLEDIQTRFNLTLPASMDNCKEDGRPYIHCQEVVEVIKAVDRNEPEGAMLVFLPGWAEIKLVKDMLDVIYPASTHTILPAHSRLSTEDQIKMFAKPLPGVRKIVLATNIAETSITIPDVVYVIDCGAHKENTLTEDSGITSLETVWVSQAAARQRAGRAGRVQPGHCYKLYTKDKESSLPPHRTPEVLRAPLDRVLLDCKTLAPSDSAESFLAQLPQPPSSTAIRRAVDGLVELGALTPSEHLTKLGVILSGLGVSARSGRALLLGALGGAAVGVADTLAHTHTHTSAHTAHVHAHKIRELRRRYSETSDHAALHCMQQEFEQLVHEHGWRGVHVQEWCDTNELRKDRMGFAKSLSNLYLENILKCGVFEPTVDVDELNRFSEIEEITSAILLAGANCLLRTKRQVRTKGKLKTVNELYTSTGDRAHIGSESVNHLSKHGPNSILAYIGAHHSPARRALVVRATSRVPPHTALIFAVGDVNMEISSGEEVNAILNLSQHKLAVHMTKSQAQHILNAREMLWKTWQYYIERDIKTLDFDENTRISRFKVRLMKAIGRILVEGHREYVLGKQIEDFVDR